MAEKVNLQQKIQAYRQSNPKLKKLSDNQILSIMVKNGAITLTAEQKQSILANSKQKDSNTGLQVEKTAKANPKKTIYLQSGRKVVYSRLADGRTVMQYFGADGTPIKPDYFKKVEGQISIAANGSSYTVTKNGKKRTLKAKNPTQGAVDQNLARLNNEEKRLNKTKKEQGLIGKGWDWVKNKTGIGDGSDKAQQQINAERKLLNQVKTGKISKKDFKNATGVEYTKENLEKFKRGELSQATAKINGYKEGQEMAADVVGDMVSGIAAVTIYTAAVAAAPFTGGASIAVGVAAATASGALIKAGVKALDTVGTDKKYTMKDFGHDLATGAFSGALAPITGGLGGAVGKTVATKLGIQAVKQVGKEVAEEVVETGVKQGLKTALTNPAGYEYVGGTLLKRGTAMAAEMATDGALGGAIDGGFRAGLDNNWDTEAMLDGAVEGGIGGAIMSPIIGGGFKTMGKGAQKVFGKDNVHINENNKVIRDDVVNDFLAGKVDDKYVAAVLRDVDDLEQAFQVAETHTKDKVKLAEAKNKILEKVNKNIADHGSIVLQNEIPASYFSVDPKSGVRYAIASQDDIFLVHAVPQGKEIKSLSYLIDVTNKKSDDAYLSLSLVNKNSSLFNDDALGFGIPVEYGIIPNNRSINVTSAGQGQASCIEKNFSVFVHHQSLENSPEHYVLLKNSLLKNLKNKGYDLTDKDYIALFNELKHKEYFNEITNDIKIGNKVLKADELRDALELSSVELSSKSMYGQGSNNEVTSIIDGIKAIFARVDNIDDVKPEIKQLAKDNGLDIILLGKPTRLDVESNPKFQSELKSIEQAFKDGKINMIQRMQQKRKLRTKYEAPEIEKLRARTTAEQKKLAQKQETPIQTQQRLIEELKTAKNREDFSRITQEIKNLPKTEEYKAVRQRLGGEYLQRYNEWKADLPESTRSIVNLATDENGGITNFDKDFNTYVLRLTKGDTNKFKNILLKHPNYSKEYLSDILKLKNSDGKFICENLLDLDLYLKAYDNNPKFAHKLTRLKNENDEYKYNAQDIEWFTDSKNLEVKNFLKDSYGTNYNEAIGNQLEQLVKNDNDKFVLLKLLTDNDRYTIEEIMDIIPYTNNDNFEVIINNKGLEPKLFIDTLVEKDIQNVNNMFGNLFNQSERKEIKSLLLKNPAKLNDLVEMVETKNSTTTEIIKNIKSNDFQINKNAQQVQTELKKIGISDDEIAALDLESPMFQLVNQRNVERLQKLTGSEDLEKILALLSSSDSKVILDKLYLFEEQNVKLNLDDIMSSVYAPECITKITTEQIKAYKKLSDSLAVNFDISNCGEIQNPKNITNEFVNAFSEKYKKLQQYGVNLDLDVDPQIIFNSIDDTLINDLKMTTELGLSFKTSQISKDSLMQAISSFKGKEYKNGSLEKLYNMDQRDKDIIKELLCIKDKNGNQRFTIADIDNIMANHTGMLSSFRTLAKQETNHEYRFNNQQLAQLMQFRHDDIMDALIKDTEVINGCTTYKYSSSEIESILTKRRQFPAFKYDRFLDELLQKKYAGKSINKIFDFILSDNKHFDIVKSLDEFCLKSKDFDLSNITELIKEKENEKQLNNLLNVAFDKKFRFDIESITLFIKNKNNKITDKILNDYPRFSLDEMKEFLRTARQDSLEEYYIFNTNLDAKTIKEYCNYIYTKHLSDNTMIKNIIQLGKNPIEFAETMPKLLYQFKAKNKYQERMVYDLIEKGKNQQEIMYIANKIQTQDDYNKVVSLMKNNDDTWQIIRILNGQSPYKKTNIDFKGYPQTLAEISKIIDTDGKISYESKVLMELKETNPSRYKKIIDSGLLDLIKEKRVSSNIVCSSNKYGRILSDNVLNDIIKIKNNVPLVTTIKNSKEFNDISKHVKNGDVCEYNGRLFANDNGKPVELKLTKEKFEELFPLLSTNMASQGYIGDCWLVSTLFGCMDKPKSRIELYKLFEQDGNDILIRFPNKKESIRFPNGDPKVNSDNPFVKGVSSYGDKPPIGLQLLEKAFTVNRSIEFKDKISSNMSNLADENALMKSILEGGEHSEALDGLFSNNTVTFERYPMNDPLNSVSKILNILQHTAEDDYILYFDTPSKGFSDAKHVKNYDMCYKHAHCIKAFDENTGTVYITNPHEGGTISKVPFFEFINYIDGITLAKFK